MNFQRMKEPESIPSEQKFPGYSNWKKKKHCGCEMIYYPEINTYFWNGWEFQPMIPFFVIFLAISSFLGYIFKCPEMYGYYNFIIIPFLLFFFLMFLYNYIKVIQIGPGYFPFDWSINSHQSSSSQSNFLDSAEDSLLNKSFNPDSVACNSDQYSWLISQPRPHRSIFARSAHRIVIRPDHLCGWTTVWIGKRNYKFFFLFNFFGLFYLLIIFLHNLFFLLRVIFKDDDPTQPIFWVIYSSIFTLFSLSFFVLTLTFAITSFCNASHGRTNWEIWNRIPYEKFQQGSTWKNLEDAFGPADHCYKWLLPYSPWEYFSNEELVSGYENYYL